MEVTMAGFFGRTQSGASRGCAAAVAAALAGCTTSAPPPAPAPVAPPAGSAAAPAALPDLAEQQWHLRAALNVAALSCGRQQPDLVASYNRMLGRHRAALDAAYAMETAAARLRAAAGWQADLDRHMTRLYNYYAWPPARDALCAAAGAVAAEAAAIPPHAFAAFAGPALARLDRLVVATHAVPALPPATTAALVPGSAAVPVRSNWQVQLGAYVGQAQAEAAWMRMRMQAPILAGFQPRYQPVPAQPTLVRLRLAVHGERSDAERLCRQAIAAGVDCRTVGRG